ncbi:MAG: ABC transporter ATP-binding protein [Verrucomicrobiae bacterium]|nr:ABC transporter ATP-binding protein [Verrucomicrobiae bacterium]
MTDTAAIVPLLEVQHLKVYFPIHGGVFRKKVGEVRAVDNVSFRVHAGETVGLVGESGSGKTTVGRAIIKLVQPTAGAIGWKGQDTVRMNARQFLPLRKQIQMIFQDPYGSLNPRMTIASILGEPLEIHFPGMSPEARRTRIGELLEQVGLSPQHAGRYPHEFSGGQRQRIGIARALAVQPELIICDEPVSALDVSVQAQIINLLVDLQKRLGLAYLFIGHDLAVIEHVSRRVLVMHQGKVVEEGSREEIYRNPREEYTRKLLAAVPSL